MQRVNLEVDKKTKFFVDAVRKNLMLAFEHLRVLIDEEDILKQLKVKDLKRYYEEYLKEDIDLDYKTVSARLNVARMLNDFENEGIEVPVKVEYTPLRTLTSAFCRRNDQRESCKLWRGNLQHVKTNFQIMEMLLTQLRR